MGSYVDSRTRLIQGNDINVGVYSLRQGFRNFGDFLGPPIISHLFSEPVTAVEVGIERRPPVLLVVGSILHLVKGGDGVWGAGSRLRVKNSK